PFQIDGDFGGAAGIAQLFLQCRGNVIEILPALPDEIPCGEIRGMRAKGGFELSLSWKDGRLLSAEITSLAGNVCYVDKDYTVTLHGSQTETKYDSGTNSWSFETTAGEIYTLSERA
ncbi:MAG: glycoside hydrolase family 95 protein, partial [Oscillospiraceae bacterium]|nr:glycoside hydrolase family 95 protein [Oscillospiraceae bacterium]